MAGIIANALAGAAQGGGTALFSVGKQALGNEYERQKQEIIAAREKSLAELNNEAAMARTKEQETGATRRTGMQTTSAESIATARNTLLASEGSANRAVSREEIAARERVSRDHDTMALKIAQMGGAVHTDPQSGNVMWIDREGRATQMTDPNTQQPMKVVPDLKPAAKAYLTVLDHANQALIREETVAMQNGDDKKVAEISAKRANLMSEVLTVATTGLAGLRTQQAGGQASDVVWNPQTGEVKVGGQIIEGKATTNEQAARLVATYRAKKPATTTFGAQEFKPEYWVKEKAGKGSVYRNINTNRKVSEEEYDRMAASVRKPVAPEGPNEPATQE